MRTAILALLAMMIASGRVSSRGSDTAKHPSKTTEVRKPAHSDCGLVTGRTLQIIGGLPGALAGKPGEPIPPQAVPHVEIYFKSDILVYKVTSGPDGAYSIKLPPGRYRIGWLNSWGRKLKADPFANSEWLSPEETEITIKSGKTYERDLPVSIMFVD